MPLDENAMEEFRAVLRDMESEDIQLRLDTGVWAREWKRSLARIELDHRARVERQEWFDAESKERVMAQKFQAAQMDRQLEVAEKQAKAAQSARWAAWAAAVATIAIAIISATSLLTE